MIADEHSFALLLTHDVDRPYDTFQTPFYAASRRDPSLLKHSLPGRNPFWQFEDIMAIEEEFGVRSAFYFLRERGMGERPLSEWLDSRYWIEALGSYDPTSPEMIELMETLEAGGWEVGLHGSYDSYRDRDRLAFEKATLESALGHEVLGGRQHYLNLEKPETWRRHAEIGLRYDASPGSSSEFGFQHGYDPFRPFDDEFVVFPLTIMEKALPDVETDLERAWRACEDVLGEAAENDAVMSILWHPRFFAEDVFPGYRELYRRIIRRALEMDAWVGAPGEYYGQMSHPDAARSRVASGRA